MNLSKQKSLSGDASFRKFYRHKNIIFIFSKKDTKKNLLIYDAINKILIKNKIKAPKLIRQNYKSKYIQIEDFGNVTVYKKIKKNNKNKLIYYKKIIKLLNLVQKIKTKKIKTFLGTNYKVPKYSKKILLDEAKLFLEWYIPKKIKKKKQNLLKKKLLIILKNLINNIKFGNKIFVHRDFHVSNLMIKNKKLCLIDNQDAVFGNIAYDLASLIDDVRLKTSLNLKKSIFEEYIKKNKRINIVNFKNDFEILSVLRNLKIIGIFMRLSTRDKKSQYLKLIPYAWKLIEQRIENNKKFIELKNILDKYFSKKIRFKK
ncbi:phosphotransferase [Candidatus Pelagibacter sp.]|nr:phosphotransferase [Candidatus Pelagibacter sp.]